MGRTKELDGKQFGDLIVIGDTGKRSKDNRQIVLAKNIKTGEFVESNQDFFVRGMRTGFIGSEENKENARRLGKIHGSKNGNKNFSKMHKKNITKGTTKTLLNDKNYSDNVTGYKNVFFDNTFNKWSVSIVVQKKACRRKFDDFKEAVTYLNDLKIKLLNPLIEEENKKIKPVNKDQIILNEYVIAKQKEMLEFIAFKKEESVKKAKISNLKRSMKSKGVSWKKDKEKWKAYITIDKKQKHLGYFDNESDAIKARKEAVEKYFKPIKK